MIDYSFHLVFCLAFRERVAKEGLKKNYLNLRNHFGWLLNNFLIKKTKQNQNTFTQAILSIIPIFSSTLFLKH